MIIIPGTDKKFSVKLSVDGVALPYASLFDYQFILYHKCENQKKQVWTFSKAGTGTTAIDIDVSITNKGYAVINRQLTSTLQPGKFYLEVKYKVTSSSEFIDTKYLDGASDIYLCDLGTSANPKAML